MIINHPLPAYHTMDKHIIAIAHYKWNYKSVCTLTTTPSDWVGELCIASLVSIWCTHYCNNPSYQSILWYYWHVTWQHCESWSIVILIHQTYYKLQWKWRNYVRFSWKMHRICYVHACMEEYPYIRVCMCICIVIQYQSTDVEFENILSHTYQSLCGEAEWPHVLCFYLNMD